MKFACIRRVLTVFSAAALMVVFGAAEAHAGWGSLGSHGGSWGGSRGGGMGSGGSWGSRGGSLGSRGGGRLLGGSRGGSLGSGSHGSFGGSRGGSLGSRGGSHGGSFGSHGSHGGSFGGGSHGGSFGSRGGSRGRLIGGGRLISRLRSHGSGGGSFGSHGSHGSHGGSWGGSHGSRSHGSMGSTGGSWGSHGSHGSSGGSYYSGSVGSVTPIYNSAPSINYSVPSYSAPMQYNMPMNSGIPVEGGMPINMGVPGSGYPVDGGFTTPMNLDPNGFNYDGIVVPPAGQEPTPVDGVTDPFGGGDSGGDTTPPPRPEGTETGTPVEEEGGNDTALLNLRVPAAAVVYVNGKRTSTPGTFRSYVSRNLVEGKEYTYEVRAEIERDGKKLSRTKVVQLGVGAKKTFDMQFDEQEEMITSVTLFVPDDAKVSLGGVETGKTGPVRYFSTDVLKNGQSWNSYQVSVTVERDGKPVTRERVIDVKAGASVNLRFDFDTGAQIATR